MSAAGAEDVSAALELDAIGDRVWQIQACSAKTSEGLQEGMEWLVGNCRKGWMLDEDEKMAKWDVTHTSWT